ANVRALRSNPARRAPGRALVVCGTDRASPRRTETCSSPVEESDVMTVTVEPTKTALGAKPATAATPADVIRKAKEAGVQMVDLRFTDLPGTWQHFSIPLKELAEELFAEGIGFDGSSIRGFQAINESDMLLVPDPNSAFAE